MNSKSLLRIVPVFVFLALIVSASEIIYNQLLIQQLDAIVELGKTTNDYASLKQIFKYLLWISFLIIANSIVFSFANWMAYSFSLWSENKYIIKEEAKFLKNVNRLPAHQVKDSNVLFSIFKFDIPYIISTQIVALWTIIISITKITFILSFLARFHYLIAIISIFATLIHLIPLFFSKILDKWNYQNSVNRDDFLKALAKNISNYEIFFFHNKENVLQKFVHNSWRNWIDARKKIQIFQRYLFNYKSEIVNFLDSFLKILLFFLIIKKWFENHVTIGSAIVILHIYGLIGMSIENISNNIISLRGIRTIKQKLKIEISEVGQDTLKENFEFLEIENLKLEKIKDNFLIKEKVRIRKGQKCAIEGPVGIGKSTVLNLISRIITGYKGKIMYNRVELKNLSEETLRKIVSYVGTSNIVFDDSLKNNVTLWDKEFDYEKFKKCIQITNLDKDFPDYESSTQSCKEFSEGQKQRVNLARAFYEDKPLIIFDEPFSNLDSKNKELIKNNIKKSAWLSKKTFIISWHGSDKEDDFFDLKIKLEK